MNAEPLSDFRAIDVAAPELAIPGGRRGGRRGAIRSRPRELVIARRFLHGRYTRRRERSEALRYVDDPAVGDRTVFDRRGKQEGKRRVALPQGDCLLFPFGDAPIAIEIDKHFPGRRAHLLLSEAGLKERERERKFRSKRMPRVA